MNFETEKDEEKTNKNLNDLAKKYLKEMEIEEFHNDLMFDLVFERDKVEGKLGKIHEDIIKKDIIQSMTDLIKIN